jgi:hypothetical protein
VINIEKYNEIPILRLSYCIFCGLIWTWLSENVPNLPWASHAKLKLLRNSFLINTFSVHEWSMILEYYLCQRIDWSWIYMFVYLYKYIKNRVRVRLSVYLYIYSVCFSMYYWNFFFFGFFSNWKPSNKLYVKSKRTIKSAIRNPRTWVLQIIMHSVMMSLLAFLNNLPWTWALKQYWNSLSEPCSLHPPQFPEHVTWLNCNDYPHDLFCLYLIVHFFDTS